MLLLLLLEDWKDSTSTTLPQRALIRFLGHTMMFVAFWWREQNLCLLDRPNPVVSYSAKKVNQERIYQSKITHKRCFKGWVSSVGAKQTKANIFPERWLKKMGALWSLQNPLPTSSPPTSRCPCEPQAQGPQRGVNWRPIDTHCREGLGNVMNNYYFMCPANICKAQCF